MTRDSSELERKSKVVWRPKAAECPQVSEIACLATLAIDALECVNFESGSKDTA